MGRCRPRTYAVGYFVAIAVFALLYWTIAGDFYHPTSRYEPALRRDREAIRRGLETAFNEMSEKQYDGLGLADHGWTLAGRPIRFDSINYADGTFTCSLVFGLESTEGRGRFSESRTFMAIKARGHTPMPEGRKGRFVLCHVDLRGGLDIGFDPRVLILRVPPGFDINKFKAGPLLAIPDTLAEAMESYADAFDGFPARSSGGEARMLYLSIVTITTLGFGDIQPVTERARLLVGAEAIAGVVLIGLFLTSLSTGQTSKPREDAAPG
jgi:hypothetical protein